MHKMDATSLYEFYRLCGVLKDLKRTGWIRNDVELPESVADHTFRVALLCLSADGSKLDRDKCIKMALVHDLAEAFVGDITPYDGISVGEKYKLEKDGLERILSSICKSELGIEIASLWEEFNKEESPEALFVRDCDKLDMLMQAHTYEKKQNLDLSQFFDSTQNLIQSPLLRQMETIIRANRDSDE